jgi:hypothetical protein
MRTQFEKVNGHVILSTVKDLLTQYVNLDDMHCPLFNLV